MHTREDETYVITQGQFRFWRGHEIIDAGPGTVLYLPRNIPHQFRNIGKTPGTLVFTITPAGLEKMFLAMSQRGLMWPKDQAAITSLSTQYGITNLPPLGQ